MCDLGRGKSCLGYVRRRAYAVACIFECDKEGEVTLFTSRELDVSGCLYWIVYVRSKCRRRDGSVVLREMSTCLDEKELCRLDLNLVGKQVTREGEDPRVWGR